ncbi:hypothetical protein [Sphingomicrobium nitratireducens]|uniref:hypothetical protein n=1 Tax=Sphingomicrobium nitratireducens TaxID=2964666 RepID=UPI00223FDB7A|nr:hypothetical protein [Sphingomicrobium nitratireducens]
MMRALRGGPSCLPSELLSGTRRAQLRALKAHANTINHARRIALEDSFKRTRELVGHDTFHEVAERHLESPATVELPLRSIGCGMAARFATPRARDLATAEWAWLEAHGAARAPALTLRTIGDQRPERLVDIAVQPHPACRLVALEDADALLWNPSQTGAGDMLLVTRPANDIRLTRIGRSATRLLALARKRTTLGRLLDEDAAATTTLVQQGALRPVLELVL